MTQKEYLTLQKNIIKNHSESQGACIKYFDAMFDYRSNTYFAIALRGCGWQKMFHCRYESKELVEPLYERITTFLEQRSRGVWHD